MFVDTFDCIALCVLSPNHQKLSISDPENSLHEDTIPLKAITSISESIYEQSDELELPCVQIEYSGYSSSQNIVLSCSNSYHRAISQVWIKYLMRALSMIAERQNNRSFSTL